MQVLSVTVWGSQVLTGIADTRARANIAGSIFRCSNVTCTAQIPPEIGAEYEGKKMIRGLVRCPQCGQEISESGGSGDFSLLYNAVIRWNAAQKGLKPYQPDWYRYAR